MLGFIKNPTSNVQTSAKKWSLNNSDRIHSCSSFQCPVTAYDADLHTPAYIETLPAFWASAQLLYIVHGASQYFPIEFIDSIVAFLGCSLPRFTVHRHMLM